MRASEGLGAAPWRRQAPVWVGLAMIAAASWSYLARLEAGMPMAMKEAPRSMMAMAGATPPDLAAAFLMWSAMMVAMMVPVAAPGVSLYLRLAERRWPTRSPFVPAAFFLAGYIAVW